jgi:hypothetical protein
MVSERDNSEAKASKDRICIGEPSEGMSSIYTEQLPLTEYISAVPLHTSPPSALQCSPSMSTPQIRCHGCDKIFNPRSLSQHLTKPQNATCRTMQMAIKTLSVFQTMTSEGSISNTMSCNDQNMEPVDGSSGEYTKVSSTPS